MVLGGGVFSQVRGTPVPRLAFAGWASRIPARSKLEIVLSRPSTSEADSGRGTTSAEDAQGTSSVGARVEGIVGGSVGVFEVAQVGARSPTHRPHVSRSEAHGILWLEHKISNHRHPTR